MSYKANTVVLIPASNIDARRIAERIEGERITDFNNHHDISDISNYEVYPITDFMDMVNNQDIENLDNYFITFVTT